MRRTNSAGVLSSEEAYVISSIKFLLELLVCCIKRGKLIQVIKGITDGGADYCFECVGDTEVITTALQCCSEVKPCLHE